MGAATRDDFIAMVQKQKFVKSEKTKTTTDAEGNVIAQETTVETVCQGAAEPDFVKLYYKTMLAFNDITGLPISFVVSLANFIEYTKDGSPLIVTINKRVKDIMMKECDVKYSQIHRYIQKAIDKGLLFHTEYKTVYEVNPFMIAKGHWQEIKKIQCRFDYRAGKWYRKVELEERSEKPRAHTSTSGTEGEVSASAGMVAKGYGE